MVFDNLFIKNKENLFTRESVKKFAHSFLIPRKLFDSLGQQSRFSLITEQINVLVPNAEFNMILGVVKTFVVAGQCCPREIRVHNLEDVLESLYSGVNVGKWVVRIPGVNQSMGSLYLGSQLHVCFCYQYCCFFPHLE